MHFDYSGHQFQIKRERPDNQRWKNRFLEKVFRSQGFLGFLGVSVQRRQNTKI